MSYTRPGSPIIASRQGPITTKVKPRKVIPAERITLSKDGAEFKAPTEVLGGICVTSTKGGKVRAKVGVDCPGSDNGGSSRSLAKLFLAARKQGKAIRKAKTTVMNARELEGSWPDGLDPIRELARRVDSPSVDLSGVGMKVTKRRGKLVAKVGGKG